MKRADKVAALLAQFSAECAAWLATHETGQFAALGWARGGVLVMADGWGGVYGWKFETDGPGTWRETSIVARPSEQWQFDRAESQRRASVAALDASIREDSERLDVPDKYRRGDDCAVGGEVRS